MIRSHEQPSADAAPPATALPETDIGNLIEELAERVRKELRLLANRLGEDAIGGPRQPGPENEFRQSELARMGQECRETLKAQLASWSPSPGPRRVLLLVCLWQESWHLLDYTLAYRSLEAAEWAAVKFAEWAAAEFARDAKADPADDPARDWEVRALRALSQAMSLITTDATLFKVINLSNAVLLEAEAKQAVRVTDDIASALAALDDPPWDTDQHRIATELRAIEAEARQNRVFYAALVRAAEALTEFERWLETAPRATFKPPSAPPPHPPGPAAEQARDSIAAAIECFRSGRAGITDPLILSRYEPWERLLVETAEIVAPDSMSQVFVPKRVSVRYLYPFAVEADEAAGVQLAEWTADNDLFDKLRADLDGKLAGIGIHVGGLRFLEPSQFFAQGDGLYGGVRVDLPEIELGHQFSSRPGGGAPERFRAWITLSSLGNHCLCIEPEADLVEPLPPVLYWTLQAATPFAVGAAVSLVDRSAQVEADTSAPARPAWDDLHSFSRDVIAAVAGARFWRITPDLLADERFMPGNLHEIVVVRTEDPLGMYPDKIADALDRDVGGRILARSIQRAATTLEEWVRYPPVPRTGTGAQGATSAIAGIPEMGLAGDWCTHTGETTVFGIVAAPSWHAAVYVEAAQFASSWPPRLQLWSRRLKSTIIQPVEADGDRHERAEQLRYLERRVRLLLAQIRAEELTATLAHRRFLDQLMGMAGLSRLEADLEAQLEAAEKLTDWFSEHGRQESDQRRQVLLTVIAVFGLFELGTFLAIANTAGLFPVGHKGLWEVWVMVGVFLLGVLAGVYLWSKRAETWVKRRWASVARIIRPGRQADDTGGLCCHEYPDTGP
jgi:hypothetical protein